ncbi:patatin [Sporanaerobium hydrogeniformans]|uniref:Patatin n=1 Tax=Sporanaerobium hydrogeniformans TaxID=3072179 RepID=A0AC61DBZ9_9FIRM|nr:patatin-like phospholipase family protein [Sporanaerobium hydrogeniformans]PHV70572.1 patatin [Sporanaerobium hydrogeniformans]
MDTSFTNLVFSGGGVWGIAYLGVLDYLYSENLMENVERIAGTSAGAITACLTSFNLPFSELRIIADSLDYSKVPGQDEVFTQRTLSPTIKKQLNKVFGNIDCVYRLIKQYGWYSSTYIYNWLQTQIAMQFDISKKQPPYTFADFQNTSIHKNNRPFLDLYLLGTDVSNQTSVVFSADSTPYVEVAEAVRISMSVPIFFEAIKTTALTTAQKNNPLVFSDGGLLAVYPIELFDKISLAQQTLGCMFTSPLIPEPIQNLIDFISHILSSTTTLQMDYYRRDPECMRRSIDINTGHTSSLNFNVSVGDPTYNFLYQAGYSAAQSYFTPKKG